jgi:Tfp pilus assembly protein PilZ
MDDVDQQLRTYSTIARLFSLIGNTPQEQLLHVLKQLLGDSFTKRLFRMILELSDDQQRLLLQRLEGMRLEDGKIEKRGHARKACLISVAYAVGNRDYQSFILDISAFGVFIENRSFLSVGQEIQMRFTIPDNPVPFQLSGEIVWSGIQGIGVKFKYLTPHQLDIIRSFAEKMDDIYEIIS